MKNEKLKNIDNIMKASDIVEFLEDQIDGLEEQYKKYVRSDGVAKRGKSMYAEAASNGIGAANTVLRWLESKMK